MKFVLEPMIFAFDHDLSKQDLIDYLEELQALDEWWDLHRDEMYVQDTAGEILCSNSYYPLADTLKPLMEKYGIDFIQYGDVNRIIDKMLNKAKSVESLYSGLSGMKKRTFHRPISEISKVMRPREMDDGLQNLLWHIFMAHKLGGHDEKAFVILTKGVSDNVSVDYEYEVLDENDGVQVKSGASVVNCKSSLEDFLNDAQTPFLLWKTAEQKDDLDLGVKVSVAQLNGKADVKRICSVFNFTIQNSFYDDYCNGHYQCKDQDVRSAIQAVTDAVTDQNLRQTHAIRTGKKGNDPQLVLNGYGALRREITTSIKLAYWKKGCVYKIANMREHDFFEPTWEDS